jgi:succinyl-CoA synthetase alpha subunit
VRWIVPVATRVKQSSYHDSVTLMLAASELLKLPGVLDAAVVMGTAANKQIVANAGLLTPESASAHPDDLLIIVRSIDATMGVAGLDKAEALLADRRMQGPEAKERRPRSLENALANAPGANLAVISVAGRYATQEAREAIARGLHVFLFSDNVSLEDEVALKALAAQRGLLLMGPDAGTAIINGIALGFGNAVPRGAVGLVSASGTGLQAVTCGLAKAGTGISQAIGVGSRDLSGQVGGVMTLAGLRALQSDPQTKVIVLISKPPGRSVVEKVLGQVRSGGKPAVVCLLGEDPALIRSGRCSGSH